MRPTATVHVSLRYAPTRMKVCRPRLSCTVRFRSSTSVSRQEPRNESRTIAHASGPSRTILSHRSVDFSGRITPISSFKGSPLSASYAFGLPFPEHAVGALYYWHPPSPCTPLAGQVRFRVLDVKRYQAISASAFAAGSDLLLPDRTPWRFVLNNIARWRRYAALKRFLVEEDIVSNSTFDKCVEVHKKGGVARLERASLLLCAIGQPFALDLSHWYKNLYALTDDDLITIRLESLFLDHRAGTHVSPHTGEDHVSSRCTRDRKNLLTRLLSVLFAGLDIPGPRLVIRVLKIIEEVQTQPGYDGWIPAPTEGELVMTSVNGHKLAPWSCPADSLGPLPEIEWGHDW
ncbi:hypothetical protein PUNSTDRAFT_55124 [Punctularia strigosozonata HHB-11173 SS5]|uniref:Uncharacterized protein n=1 Tax=Punctularia strigosozonata (strain HHB-11173) TaxID=741275 RepID=R7S5K3_PUNST|nr:uncharacterized protein PUNSTDRAFT_55124 [Punctularia strigosozonata HHB-11173 SS5]EIN05232.1 hypothetical protein PUNSTDRAFT_55124 [Punctularia strigosozonata HHB-11173 SS5]